MSINPLNDISKVYLEQVATEAFVDPEQGEAPSGRSPLQNVSDHPNPLVRKKAVKAFKKQMGKEYGGTWKSRSKDPVDEAAKPDYLDFDKDDNETESMKKALRDKAKKKNLEERFRRGGGSMAGQPGGPSPRNQTPASETISTQSSNSSSRKGGRGKAAGMAARMRFMNAAKHTENQGSEVQEAKKPNDGDLANNYPPYDKVTRGDVIAGRLGKDQMGGKVKVRKEGYSNWREDLREVMSSVEKKEKDVKITEKEVNNKIKTSAMGGGITLPEAIENLGGTLLEMVELDEKITAETDMGAAIKDFYTSKSPQLAGRTKEERRKAAIAAVLTARRGGRKRVAEQAMEVQPKTTATAQEDPKAKAAAQKAKAAEIGILQRRLQAIRQTPAGTPVSGIGG